MTKEEKEIFKKEEDIKKEKEKNKLYNSKISEVIKQIVELEKIRDHLDMEKDLDFYELKDKKT